MNMDVIDELSRISVNRKAFGDFENVVAKKMGDLAIEIDTLPKKDPAKGRPKDGDGIITIGEITDNKDSEEKIGKTLEDIAKEFMDRFQANGPKSIAPEEDRQIRQEKRLEIPSVSPAPNSGLPQGLKGDLKKPESGLGVGVGKQP